MDHAEQGFDPGRLATWLSRALDQTISTVSISKLAGGHSSGAWRLDLATGPLVLKAPEMPSVVYRRDACREARILGALGRQAAPVPTVVVVTFTLIASWSCPQRLTSTSGPVTARETVTTRFFWVVFACVAAQTVPAGTGSAEAHAIAANVFLMPDRKAALSESQVRKPCGSFVSGCQLYDGCSGSSFGLPGCCEKSNSLTRFPRSFAFSRTTVRESGRPSVFGSIRRPPRKSSSMNFR